MIRKAVGVAVAGFCVLSLLACAGAGWLWWRAGHGRRDGACVAAGGRYVEAASGRDGVRVLCVGDWPGRRSWRAWAVDGSGAGPETVIVATAHAQLFAAAPGRWTSLPGGGGFGPGRSTLTLNDDGSPAALTPAVTPAPESGPVWLPSRDPIPPPTASLPAWEAAGVPHVWAVAGTALPPLLWLAARGRRAWGRRRRRRLGLCLACGYDLRGNPSGVCPECGAAAPKGATG